MAPRKSRPRVPWRNRGKFLRRILFGESRFSEKFLPLNTSFRVTVPRGSAPSHSPIYDVEVHSPNFRNLEPEKILRQDFAPNSSRGRPKPPGFGPKTAQKRPKLVGELTFSEMDSPTSILRRDPGLLGRKSCGKELKQNPIITGSKGYFQVP